VSRGRRPSGLWSPAPLGGSGRGVTAARERSRTSALRRRHARLLSRLAFGLLALAAELLGRSLTHRLDLGRHVEAPGYVASAYYPFLLAAVKIGVALLLARLAWRFARARSSARAARRVLTAVGSRPVRPLPKVRLALSPRLWLLSFLATSVMYLVQTDSESAATGRWPLLAPWLHTSALPIFAVLSVVVAICWGAICRWLADYERYARETVAQARSLLGGAALPAPHAAPVSASAPRRLFGLAFECRPPPLLA
jgi:hypothetical protein